MIIEPIGKIYTEFNLKNETPIQGTLSQDSIGRVEVYPQYADGLKDIETFSHIILVYHFDQAGEVKLIRPTFLDDDFHGVFASRHPCRPNGIGLTIVKLVSRLNNTLNVSGIDVLNETPLIDIKPYISRFDCFPNASEGWVSKLTNREKPKGRE
jgi:tRNA-Thr(GGU) m(6)t(6)A37 methyltransferase TsaA